jgi:hypothetical protein
MDESESPTLTNRASLERFNRRANSTGASIWPMPKPSAGRAFERGLDSRSMDVVPSSNSTAGADLLYGPDPSIHMIGEPRTYPHLKRWLVLAILGGAIAAFLLVLLTGN